MKQDMHIRNSVVIDITCAGLSVIVERASGLTTFQL